MGGLTRRSAITLSVAAPATGMGFPLGGEVDSSMVGINVKLAWIRPDFGMYIPFSEETKEQWCVWLPDWENQSSYFRPGMVVKGKWVPLTEYLGELETEFKLV